MVDAQTLRVTASIGAAAGPAAAVDDPLRAADAAMYRAKRGRTGNSVEYAPLPAGR